MQQRALQILNSAAQQTGSSLEQMSERQKAVALHDFVRSIPFGFNPRFEESLPEETLFWNKGHCTPKSRLLVSLLLATGIEARMHFVNINNDVLHKATSLPIPRVITHSYTEVKFQDSADWLKVDSYVIDPPKFQRAQEQNENDIRLGSLDPRVAGAGRYGIRAVGATNTWDGTQNAFSQLDDRSPKGVLFDFVDSSVLGLGFIVYGI
eukprot:CAMPEP_0184326804 /NCGR_PEP_ID=MMETSP1049-20130417/142749_1 /TAXON_ID=77928 /ORGANISM="Proteomonas sulcata, Strain CCMP704" /LENGTH=207 /DNA_ID=CAMNT_0026649019 /DNA_START=104 /DNA_END=727 /DNA_ORIENTATION=-